MERVVGDESINVAFLKLAKKQDTMNTAARGARRKPAAVRGKRPGSSSSRTGMTRSAADVSGYTAANNRQTENSKSQISVKDVQEEHREGIAWYL